MGRVAMSRRGHFLAIAGAGACVIVYAAVIETHITLHATETDTRDQRLARDQRLDLARD